MVKGLVNKTECWSGILGKKKKFREKILKGAFDNAIKKAKRIDFLAEHNKNLLLSTTENGSLELWEDEDGLQMRSQVSPTSYGKDIYTLIKDRIINHMSFGFKVLKDSWTRGADGIYERVISELELSEVSAVRNPCYSQSVIEARGLEVASEDDVIEEIIEKRNEDNENDISKLKEEIKAEILKDLQKDSQKNSQEELKENSKKNNSENTPNLTVNINAEELSSVIGNRIKEALNSIKDIKESSDNNILKSNSDSKIESKLEENNQIEPDKEKSEENKEVDISKLLIEIKKNQQSRL